MEKKDNRIEDDWDIEAIKNNALNFCKAYNILMDYWDYFPEDLRPEIDERLNGVGL